MRRTLDGDVTIDATVPLNIAMTVEPQGWFVDANGAAIDPTDPTLHGTTALAICKSLDTQPKLSGQGGPSSKPAGAHGGGPGGNGNQAHCVEPAQ